MKRLLFIASVILSLQASAQQNLAAADTTVYTVADTMPEYPGGTRALMDYLSKNIVFKGPNGNYDCSKIDMYFIVDRKGNIIQPRVTAYIIGDEKAPLSDFLISVEKILTAMPLWTPGRKNGQEVNVKLHLPMFIRLY